MIFLSLFVRDQTEGVVEQNTGIMFMGGNVSLCIVQSWTEEDDAVKLPHRSSPLIPLGMIHWLYGTLSYTCVTAGKR